MCKQEMKTLWNFVYTICDFPFSDFQFLFFHQKFIWYRQHNTWNCRSLLFCSIYRVLFWHLFNSTKENNTLLGIYLFDLLLFLFLSLVWAVGEFIRRYSLWFIEKVLTWIRWNLKIFSPFNLDTYFVNFCFLYFHNYQIIQGSWIR